MPLDDVALLVSFAFYLALVFLLAIASHRLLQRKEFLGEYFLGSRGLGVWAFAFTFAATSASGGSFMGFPSLIYRNGWVLALWIGSYMVVPVCTIGLLAKRINELGRRLEAITIPDLLRERFQSPALGVAGGLITLLFVAFNLVAQFKAGGLVLKTLLETVPGYGQLVNASLGWLGELFPRHAPELGPAYWGGLLVFSLMVIGYTTYGGFRAVVWTDVLQGVAMGAGVLILLPLALIKAGGLTAATAQVAAQDPSLVSLPGPGEFLAFPVAVSFWVMWAISGTGQPGTMVRLMAFRDSRTMRYGIFTVMVYYSCIYLPLVVIFVCARAIVPLGTVPEDQIMPYMARTVAPGWLAGILIAAPFAAVMSTVDSFLLLTSSAIVRDLVQKVLKPDVSPRTVKALSYGATGLIGLAAMLVAIDPPQFLQDIIVFTGSGLASCFLMPVLLGLYWRRATAIGALAAMLGGTATHLAMYLPAWIDRYLGEGRGGNIVPLRPLGLDAVVWGLLASLLLGVIVSLLTHPPQRWLIRELFGDPHEAEPPTGAEAPPKR